MKVAQSLVLSVFLLISGFVSIAAGAGVTIVTHGASMFQLDKDTLPFFGMGHAIDSIARLNTNAGITYGNIVIRRKSHLPPALELSVESNDLDLINVSGPDVEIVILVNWTDAALFIPNPIPPFSPPLEGFVSATAIASKVMDELISNLDGKILELPIHLIGHSRGGSVVYELARLLGEKGLWIDHVTTLDPHPVDNIFALAQDIDTAVNPEIFYSRGSGIIDPDPKVYENILFADNYYQRHGIIIDGDFDGMPVSGAYNRLIDHEVIHNGGNQDHEHYNTHLWYHGTIDTVSTDSVSDGEHSITPGTRSAWYSQNIGDNENFGKGTGFRFSRIAEQSQGSLRKTGYVPYFSAGSVGLGYSGDAGGAGNRFPIENKSQAIWPNLLGVDIISNGVTLDAGQHGADISSYWEIEFTYSCYHSASLVEFYLDTDRNPYNGFAGEIGNIVVSSTVSADNIRMPVVIPSLGIYYICGKITDVSFANSRYLYSRPKIAFKKIPENVFFISAFDGQNGEIFPEGTFQLVAGKSKTFSASPNAGFDIDRWYLDGEVSQVGDSEYTLANVQFSHAIYVTFKPIIVDSRDLQVIAPNGGETWFIGRSAYITWQWEGDIGNTVRIELYRGGVLDRTITNVAHNDGKYRWGIPDDQLEACNYQVKVSSIDNSHSDISDGNFCIQPYEKIDTVLISTCAQLQNVSTAGTNPVANVTYVLTQDIDARSCGNFDPIGSSSGFYFRGTFDGQGHTITRLGIDRPTESHIGLFSILDEDGVIKNLNIAGIDGINGGDWTGGLVGDNFGTIINCTVEVFDPIKGRNHVGGIAGENSSTGLIRNCSVDIIDKISGLNTEPNPDDIGGIAGVNSGRIEWCFTHGIGDIDARSTRINQKGDNVGGIVGYQTLGHIHECYSTVHLVDAHIKSGGIVGLIQGGEISDSYFSGSLVRANFRAGGIAGEGLGGAIRNCYVVGNIHAFTQDEGALIGKNGGTTVSNSFWCATPNQATADGGSFMGSRNLCDSMVYPTPFITAGWDFSGVWAIQEDTAPPVLRGIGPNLSSPTGLVASNDSPDGVYVSWEPVTYQLAGSARNSVYAVYRSILPEIGNQMKRVGSWQSSTTFLDTTALKEETYYYSVVSAATSKGARQSSSSGVVSGLSAYPPLAPPTGIAASDGLPLLVLVQWTAVTNANHYRVYRSDTLDGTKTALGTWISELSYIDAPPFVDSQYFYSVVAVVDTNGQRQSDHGDPDSGYAIDISTDVNDESQTLLPEKFSLSQNYPNPFNPTTTISFALPTASHVTVEIFNVMGQRVKTLTDAEFSAGEHSVTWNSVDNNGAPVASGMYFYRMKAGDFVQTRKMVLLK